VAGAIRSGEQERSQCWYSRNSVSSSTVPRLNGIGVVTDQNPQLWTYDWSPQSL
jgi:hypothetical protein